MITPRVRPTIAVFVAMLAFAAAAARADAQSPASSEAPIGRMHTGGRPASLVRMSDGECLNPADAVLTRPSNIFLALYPQKTAYPLPARTRLLFTYIAQDIAADLARIERSADGRARLLPADDLYPPTVTLSVATFSLRHDGTLADVDLSDVVHDGLRAALQARFDSIAARGGVGGFDARGLPPEIPLALNLTPDVDTTTAAAPLFTLEIPFDRVATFRPGNHTPPPYPEEARGLGVETSVLLTFVVDEDGRAQAETIRTLPDRKPGSVDEARLADAFERSAKLAVRSYRYTPAQVLGCHVKMWVQQPFTFAIQP
jgi:hypothetical protein